MHWIEAYRRRMCMEARELAELAGVTESLIYILENQVYRRRCSVDTAVRWLEAKRRKQAEKEIMKILNGD